MAACDNVARVTDAALGAGLRIGLLWRSEWDPVGPGGAVAENSKLHAVFEALAALGVTAEPVVYSDDRAEQVLEQLVTMDGVLVWVNPIQDGLDRSTLDPVLLRAASTGVWVSAHPNVILKMGTKEVIYRTREMSWGSDVRIYHSFEEFRREFPESLGHAGPRVLKQHRGMGGAGVWSVEREGGLVRVQHAEGGSAEERLLLADFVARCEPYFVGPGLLVDQPYLARIDEGMIRVYLTHDKVVGFAHQYPRGLRRTPLPSPTPPKRFEGADAPAFEGLRLRMETEWVPELQRILDVDTHSLPVIWDADFLYGPKGQDGNDTHVLCEINVSSTFAFPDQALAPVAKATVERVRAHTRSGY
jgi:hypothetical protein